MGASRFDKELVSNLVETNNGNAASGLAVESRMPKSVDNYLARGKLPVSNSGKSFKVLP
jgi:hypothetical protein